MKYEQKWQTQCEMLANRIGKNRRQLKTWVRANNIFCYRVYDRDIPEIPLVIDWYDGFVYAAEYDRPNDYSMEEHSQWIDRLIQTVANIFGVDKDKVFLKTRKRQRGDTQYQPQSSLHTKRIVREGGCKFFVNFTDYIDAGLFLDHRATRALVGEQAKGKRFLNLFSYTGAFTVHAAKGGASTSTSVDMSNTYNAWALDNMQLNDIATQPHEILREDIYEFLNTTIRRRVRSRGLYDIAVVDPPTFSNSKKMDKTWDVQRDHAWLLKAVLQSMNVGGKIYFSTNFRKFILDKQLTQYATFQEITHKTIPRDFRNKKIHRCWEISCTQQTVT